MAYLPNTLSGVQALEPGRTFDYIVPYPYGSNIGIRAGRLEPFLSTMSTMAIDAAVEAWKGQPNAKIVIPGESPFGRPDTGDLMVRRAVTTSDIAVDDIVPMHELTNGRGLDNTYLQSEGLAEFFSGNSDGILTLALKYHMKRVQRALDAHGVQPVFATVESILHARGITEYDRYLPVIDGLKRTELLAWVMTNGIGLPKGQLPNYLMKRSGPRIVDVIEGEDGKPKLEKDFAWKKRDRLIRELGAASRQKAA